MFCATYSLPLCGVRLSAGTARLRERSGLVDREAGTRVFVIMRERPNAEAPGAYIVRAIKQNGVMPNRKIVVHR
jgi:hypothetical protein